VPRCCAIVYTGIRKMVGASEREGFQAGSVSSRAVSTGANGKVHTAGMQDTSTSEEVRCRTRRVVWYNRGGVVAVDGWMQRIVDGDGRGVLGVNKSSWVEGLDGLKFTANAWADG
jgi:hypothetical protein